MNKSKKLWLALALFLLGCVWPEKSISVPTNKYEFPQVSPNVVLSGGSFGGTCTFQPNLYWGGTATISYTDTQMGGTPVTFQAGYACSGAASTVVTVNNNNAGNMALPVNSCCGVTPAVQSLTITSAYNNAASTKSISFGIAGMLLPFTSNQNTTDPVFRITYTMLPGVSTPAAGGFTNTLMPTLSWPTIAGATQYQLQVAVDPFFNTPLVNVFPASNSYTVPAATLSNGVSYYTRVRASVGGSFVGIWSYIGDFTVAQTGPAAPATITPSNGVSVPVQTPTFNWSAVTTGPE